MTGCSISVAQIWRGTLEPVVLAIAAAVGLPQEDPLAVPVLLLGRHSGRHGCGDDAVCVLVEAVVCRKNQRGMIEVITCHYKTLTFT